MDATVKQEAIENPAPPSVAARLPGSHPFAPPSSVIDLSDSDSDDAGGGGPLKRRKYDPVATAPLPLGFLDPLPTPSSAKQRPRQFWKAGDFEGPASFPNAPSVSSGMDHVRVHPKFLHSNATSHKWALGAFAELLDNAMDEVINGATFVKVDMLENRKDRSKMLLIEDDGGGMDTEKMRQCMSLGYSVKSKLANTIGQYGNGFKTSTMRLGADVLVFSRHRGKDRKSATQSIGMLSYTFLTKTGKEDIVVPMLDFEKRDSTWSKVVRSSLADWETNSETILSWSPYTSEAELLHEFNSLAEQGTRIVIYNLWDDEGGRLELDFNADRHDIQIGGVNRDEKKIQMASHFPNSRHFLTYQHSLRSYASILYLRLPPNFKIILRGKEIEHHSIVDDMMLRQEFTYKPQGGTDGVPKDPNLVAVVTIGFVKDARDHIDVQGFNVYHKNRLIKPFWRLWNASGSNGRGVIGVLEANFVEPAHDKQGFERTTVLSRLEARLVMMQKNYWSTYCHRIGYAPRRNKKLINGLHDRDSSPEESAGPSGHRPISDACVNGASPVGTSKDLHKTWSAGPSGHQPIRDACVNGTAMGTSKDLHKTWSAGNEVLKTYEKIGKKTKMLSRLLAQSHSSSGSDSEIDHIPAAKVMNQTNGFKAVFPYSASRQEPLDHLSDLPCAMPSLHDNENGLEVEESTRRINGIIPVKSEVSNALVNVVVNDLRSSDMILEQLKEENCELKDRLKKMEASMSYEIDQEKERCKVLTDKLEEAERKLEEANREQDALIEIFSDERLRRDKEEETLRRKLKDAAVTIQELLHKLANKSSA